MKLTELSHGGGCGCKIAPSVLESILNQLPLNFPAPNALVGFETRDDAAAYKINDTQAIVLTTDFFMPIVDDPTIFGQIAATNAISDIYAMGAKPLFALSILGMPLQKLSTETIGDILKGAQQKCHEAQIPILGGHSIDTLEPIFGLVVAGIIDPKQMLTNSSAKAGDCLILTKPLGVGLLSTCLKRGTLEIEDYFDIIESMTKLNSLGEKLSSHEGVHALTDVTGFGLLGHLSEMCGKQLSAQISLAKIPRFKNISKYLLPNNFPGGALRNWEAVKEEVDCNMPEVDKLLLCDPQTSGGLLIACRSDVKQSILELCNENSTISASVIGELSDNKGGFKIKITES